MPIEGERFAEGLYVKNKCRLTAWHQDDAADAQEFCDQAT
jgi:hypothetical protein